MKLFYYVAILPKGSKPRLYRPRICFMMRRLNGVCCPSEIFSISDGTVIATLLKEEQIRCSSCVNGCYCI